jgi:hypothetical protein
MPRYFSPPLLFRLAALLGVVLIITGLAVSAASAVGHSDYSISWYTFDGGGGVSSGDTYTLMGTIGQPDAGVHSGTGYDLSGGFWAWVARYLGYLPLIKKP